MSDRAPLSGCEIFAHMVKCRDDKIDEISAVSMKEQDPMADVSAEAVIELPSLGRPTAFAIAQIPALIEVHFDGFTTPDGQRIGSHAVKVVSIPKRGIPLTIEASPANVEGLRSACTVIQGSTPRIESGSVIPLPVQRSYRN